MKAGRLLKGGVPSRLKECAGWYFRVYTRVRLLRRDSSPRGSVGWLRTRWVGGEESGFQTPARGGQPAWPPLTECGGALHEFAAHCPQAVWRCITRGVLQDFHYPLPTGTVAVHTAIPLRTAPRQCGGALQEVYCRISTTHCPQALWRCIQQFHCPLPPGSVAVHCRRSLRTAPRQCGCNALRHCRGAVRSGIAVCTPTVPVGSG